MTVFDDEDDVQVIVPEFVKTDTPKVSVVMTVLNGAAYLAQAIESVLNQTYPNVELIVVNDGSTDATGEIIESFFEKFEDDHLRLITHEKPKGIARSRNAAIKQAEGDFICVLDGDDYFSPSYIEDMIRLAKEYPEAGIFVSDYCNFTEAETLSSHFTSCTQLQALWAESGRSADMQLSSIDATRILATENFSSACTSFFRWSILQKVGGYKESLRACEDFHLVFRVATHSYLVVSSKIGMYRRLHSNNLSSESLVMARNYCVSRFDLLWRHALPEVRWELRARAEQYRGSYFFLALKKLSIVDIGRALLYYSPL